HAYRVASIRDRPVDGQVDDVARARAAEHAVGVDVSARSHPGTYVPRMRRDRGRVVRSFERRPIAEHAETGERAGRVRSVAVAVKRVGVGDGYGARVVRVVGVADEVVTALHLRRRRAEEAWVGRRGARCLGSAPGGGGAWPAEICVRVVDAGVDAGGLDAFSGHAEAPPRLGRAYERHAVDVVGHEGLQGVDGGDPGKARELREALLGHDHLDAVVGVLHLAHDLSAGGRKRTVQLILLRLKLRPDRVLVGRTQLLAALLRVSVLDGDRRTGPFQTHGR